MSSPAVEISKSSQTASPPDSQLSLRNNLKTILQSFLGRCNFTYTRRKIDSEYIALCAEEARRRKYPMEGTYSLAPFIRIGAIMASTAYAHVENQSTRILMAMYTSCMIYADTVFQNDTSALSKFTQQFLAHGAHVDPVLDALADIIVEIHQHFDPIAANIATTSAMDGVTGLLLEMETRQMKIYPEATGYPAFARIISGFPDIYIMWIFPRELPISAFIQALPDMRAFLSYHNDILSFYKEELAGETVNYVSQVAAAHGIRKLDALQRVIDETVEAHQNTLRILAHNDTALAAYKRFSEGIVSFHLLNERYKLDELDL